MTKYISNLNNMSIGGDILPDNWKNNGVRLANNVSIAASATNTYSISTLTSDNNYDYDYDYEVTGFVWITSGSTNGQQPTVAIKNGNDEFTQRVSCDYVRSGATVQGGGNFKILVHGRTPSIKVQNIRNYAFNIWVVVSFFRRVGSNT